MKALIMAGGKGTRLTEITKNEIPKPMAKIAGRPILEWAILNLKKYGVDEFYLSVGHLSNVIIDYFKDGSQLGVKINYLHEETPLGSAGALFYLKDKIDGDFIVCSGDAIFDINVDAMLQYHLSKKAIITMLTHPNMHPYDSDLVINDEYGRVLNFDKKNSVRNYYYKNNVNAGFFIINSKALDYFKELKKVAMESDFIADLIKENKSIYAYKSTEYIKDVGTPERFIQSEKDIINGIVSSKNIQNKQKAIFLDRDGTLNLYKGFINSAGDIQLVKDCSKAIRKINESGYLAILVTNQPVIARGECSFEELDNMFNKIETLLGKEGAYLDAIYYCPHHPHSGFEGEVKELKINCNCRKPKTGMLEAASRDFNLDLSKCYVIGDGNADVLLAKNVGIKSIRVKSALKEDYVEPADYNAKNLLEAVNFVFEGDKINER